MKSRRVPWKCAHRVGGGSSDWAMTTPAIARVVLADLYGDSSSVLWDATNATENYSETNTTLAASGHDDVGGLNNWWAMLALVLVLGTAAGNILVCMAIAWERRLQNVTNYFLMSLAITDLMVAILVMPLGILTLVRGKFSLLPPASSSPFFRSSFLFL